MQIRYRKLIVLSFLLVVFLLPFILARFWQPSGTINQGNLFQPPYNLQALISQELSGTAYTVPPLIKKWSLLFLWSPQCNRSNECEKIINDLLRIRIAQGKKSQRVIITVIQPFAQPLHSLPDSKILEIVNLPTQVVANIAKSLQPLLPNKVPRFIYLRDPNGLLVTSYPLPLTKTALSDDLRRLLRYTRSG